MIGTDIGEGKSEGPHKAEKSKSIKLIEPIEPTKLMKHFMLCALRYAPCAKRFALLDDQEFLPGMNERVWIHIVEPTQIIHGNAVFFRYPVKGFPAVDEMVALFGLCY